MRHALKDIAFAINGKSIGKTRLKKMGKQRLRPYLKGEPLAKDISHNMTEKSITLIIKVYGKIHRSKLAFIKQAANPRGLMRRRRGDLVQSSFYRGRVE